MELRDYLKVVRRRWRVILVSLVVVVALASLVTLRTTPQYESKARLFVSSTERSTSDAYQGGLFSIQRVSSYADLVKGQEPESWGVVITVPVIHNGEVRYVLSAAVRAADAVTALIESKPSAPGGG